jgi:outer membrane protein TolC
MRDVAAMAVANDPDLVAARAEHGVGQAALLNAGMLPDPSFSGGVAALISGPGSVPAISGSLSQDLSALVTYRVDLRAARAGLAQVDAGILWQEWQVAGQAEALCIALNTDAATVAGLREDAAALGQVDAAMRAQVAAGNATIGQSSASAAALAANQTALDAALQGQAQDVNALDALLGLQPSIPVTVAPPVVTAPSDAVVAAGIAGLARTRPDLIALRYGYEQADARLRGAILAQFLPISLGGSGGRDTSNVWSAGPQLTLNLPLFNRGRGAVAMAAASRAQLAAQFAASLAGAEAGARALVARIAMLRGQAAAADAAAARAAATGVQTRRAELRGALNALDAVTLLTASADRRREAITLHGELATAQLALDTMLGIGLPPLAEHVLEPE